MLFLMVYLLMKYTAEYNCTVFNILQPDATD